MMYLHALLLFHKQIQIQPRTKAVYFLGDFDENNSLEYSPGIVKMIQIILKIVSY